MVKQNIASLLIGGTLLFSCAGGPRVIDVKFYTTEEELISHSFDLNKGEEIKLIIDFSNFSDSYNLKQYGYVQFYSEPEDKLFTVFSEITLFKYNNEDVSEVSDSASFANTNNTYITTYKTDTIVFHHDSPNKDDKIIIVGKANNDYEHLVVYSAHSGTTTY